MSNASQGIHTIYQERSKFVVIGLTGRAGSGCSTVANILTQDFNQVKLPEPFRSNFPNNSERKYTIVYDYISKHWQEFYKISVADMITLFILDEKVEDFAKFIDNNSIEYHNNNNNEKNKKTLFEEKIKNDFNDYQKRRNKCKNILKKPKQLEITEKEFEDCDNFYFKTLSYFTCSIKKTITEFYPNIGDDKIYQLIGNNIRSSGEAFVSKTDNYENIYKIAKLINKFIKLIRRIVDNNNNKKNAMIVIDGIKNPFEAFFFQERYSAFYLMSVNTEDDSRIKRLQEQKNLNREQIKNIEESPESKKFPKFITEDIQKCIEISDIHLNNPQQGNEDRSLLKKQLAQYLALIIHPGLITPTPTERCMQIAYGAKLNSGCISRQVGAVITDQNYSIKAVGWNDTPAGQVPCLLRSATSLFRYDDREAFSDYENNDQKFQDTMKETYFNSKSNSDELKGRNLSFCFKDVKNSIEREKNQVHTRSLHAEENAFLQISKYGGIGIKGGILFTTASPCELCAKKAYQLGIQKIIYIDPYPGIAEEHILKSGRKKPEMQLFHGAIGRAYPSFVKLRINYQKIETIIL